MNPRCLLAGSVLLASALSCSWAILAHPSGQERPAGNGSERTGRLPSLRSVDDAFVAIAERLAPSVVRITTRLQAPPTARRSDPAVDPFEGTPFERFFERFGRLSSSVPPPRSGMGSGLVIDDQGHILTNNHVVAQAEDVRVTFVDGRELKGRVLGTDPKTDLAVIKVDDVTSKAAEFADPEQLRVGEWVMAIGNPFGLDHSVTVGVLSAKGRYGFAPGRIEDFLQTDASINPGNSGGPLVNLSGQVIGINTMIAGLGTGVGFAVSGSIAKPIARQLIEHGKVTRPYLGVVMQTITPNLSRAMADGAPDRGALVAQVQRGSPAAEAGVLVGDVVTAVGGRSVKDSRDVQRAVLEHKVGEKVDLTLWRAGKELKVDVRTSELPAEQVAADPSAGRENRLGMGFQTLTRETADRLGIDPDTEGVVVTSVRPGSVAAEAGLREGDVLVSVDRKAVATVDEAAKYLREHRPGGHLAHIRRGDGALFLALPNP